MSKYEPLAAFLRSRTGSETPMRFDEIEQVIGARLPPKAQAHRAWWSNNPSNNTMTKFWLDAGYRTERVDMAARRLVFRRVRPAPNPATGAANAQSPNWLEQLQSRFAGTMTLAPDFDPASPTGEGWDAER